MYGAAGGALLKCVVAFCLVSIAPKGCNDISGLRSRDGDGLPGAKGEIAFDAIIVSFHTTAGIWKTENSVKGRWIFERWRSGGKHVVVGAGSCSCELSESEYRENKWEAS